MTKVAICGDGVAGSYLYRLLTRHSVGFEVTLFGKKEQRKCEINPCAWGVTKAFFPLVREVGLDPDDYILSRFKDMVVNGHMMGALFYTIDKPKLLADLKADTEVSYTNLDHRNPNFDCIVDATGVERVYLPPVANGDDVICPCYQMHFFTRDPITYPVMIQTGHVGYAWFFPLGPHECHFGCGSLVRNPKEILNETTLGLVRAGEAHKSNGLELRCACASRVRLNGPQASEPFVHGNIWGVGESIGCVSPIIGEGIVPAMECAQIFANTYPDAAKYTEGVKQQFGWMKNERRALNKMRAGKRFSVFDLVTIKTNAARAGMNMSIQDIYRMLKGVK